MINPANVTLLVGILTLENKFMSGFDFTGTSCKCIAKNKLQVITSENRRIIFNISGNEWQPSAIIYCPTAINKAVAE